MCNLVMGRKSYNNFRKAYFNQPYNPPTSDKFIIRKYKAEHYEGSKKVLVTVTLEEYWE